MASLLNILNPSDKANLNTQKAQKVSPRRRLRQLSDARTEKLAGAATPSPIRKRVKQNRELRTGEIDDSIYDVPSSATPDPPSWNGIGGEKASRTHEGRVQQTQMKDVKAHKYAFDHLVEYRWRGNSIEIKVQWDDGESTWESEANLHEDALESLLTYWQSQNGRPRNPKDPDMYDIFAIRKHSRDRKKLFVEWVGYGPGDMTWVSRTSVEKTAPELVTQYLDKLVLKRRNRPRKRR